MVFSVPGRILLFGGETSENSGICNFYGPDVLPGLPDAYRDDHVAAIVGVALVFLVVVVAIVIGFFARMGYCRRRNGAA